MSSISPIVMNHITATTALDRMGGRRHDTAWIAALHARGDARFYLLIRLKFAVLSNEARTDTHLRMFAGAELATAGIATERALFLGLDAGGVPHFAVSLQDAEAARLPDAGEGFEPLVDLRTLALQGVMSPEELSIASQARALAAWHATQRCCGRCGAHTVAHDGGWRRDCWACGQMHFPRTDPAVIMLITHGGRALLGNEPRFPEGFYSVLAGFVEPGDDIENAVRREVMEEAGLPVGAVRYVTSQPWAFPHSLMIGCWGEALSDELRLDGRELPMARWVGREEMADMLAERHPEGITVPKPLSIAHTLMRAFAEGRLG